LSIEESLNLLTELQAVDSKLLDLEISKGDLPKLVQDFEKKIAKLERQIQETDGKLTETQKIRRQTEGQIKLEEEKLKKYQNQLYDVTTNKEYDSLTQEIENEKNLIENLETQILEYITIEEETEKDQTGIGEEMERYSNELKEKKTELNEMLKSSENEELKLQHAREKIVHKLKKPLLNKYMRINKAKHGLAVVPVTRNACGGCFKAIPPQEIVEIRKRDKMICCETCGRMLVWNNKE